jgi:glycosyltransferase involved in cell wall biosynthesis
MNYPVIHVLIPTYNRAHTICSAIDSVISCEIPNLKIFIIENSSDDATVPLIQKEYSALLESSVLKLVCFDETVPIIENWNRCFNFIDQADYVKFLWSDDRVLPVVFKRMIKTLDESPSVDIVGCDVSYVGEAGQMIERRRYGSNFFQLIGSLFYKNMLGCPSSLLFRRLAIKDLKFNESNRYAADLQFVTDLIFLNNCQHLHINETGVKVLVQSGTETNTLFGSKLMIDCKKELLDNALTCYFKLPRLVIAPLLFAYKHSLNVKFKFF